MSIPSTDCPAPVVTDSDFSEHVQRRSGVNLNLCSHCLTCAGGCPFSDVMDIHPNWIIRLVQLGLKEEALQCSSIWICVGCNTCSIQCPNCIDISSISHALCQMAIEENTAVAEPDILAFHREVLNSIRRYGRTHKLEIMMRYKLHKWDLFSDIGVGLRMFAKRKLGLLPSRVKRVAEIKYFFKRNGGI
jgi:heterodisulfide reductase subunit C